MNAPRTADNRKIVWNRKANSAQALPADPDEMPMPPVEQRQELASAEWIAGLKSKSPEDNLIDDADSAYKGAVQTYAALMESREKRDPRLTRAAHLEQLQKTAETARKNALGHVDKVRQDLALHSQKNERDALEALGIDRDHHSGAEMRQILRGQTSAERSKMINEAIEAKDPVVLAAVQHASHPATVGLSKRSELEAIKRRVLHELQPERLKKADNYRQAHDLLTRLTFAWIETEDALTAHELREQYRKQAEASKTALTAAQALYGAT